MSATLYPPSPSVNTESVTQITPQYRTQIIVNLVAIIIFFLLYLVMIAGSIYLIKLAWEWPLGDNYSVWPILAKFGTVGMAVMLFLFLMKFLFKRHNFDNPANIEIFEKDHPELFAFVRKLSHEVGAPFPKKIFVNHEINASVFYNSTILSLFFPVKKNLLIGLGVVNSVNLSEFKAIIAHEFGHFAQSSMKLGSYVYMANRIIHDMVYERDRWDLLLEEWRRADIRLSIFAWLLMPVIWIVRLFMGLLYQGLNLLHSALSRQMEYNADLVAVSVTGSDQIINGLYKLGITYQTYEYTMATLADARDHQLITDDMFYNHRESHKQLMANTPELAQQDLSQKYTEGGGKQLIFDTDEGSSNLSMYDSHPSNFKRERNAKALYVPGTTDERSPWLLFGDAEGLSQQVTKNLYELSLGKAERTLTPKDAVQDFINEEMTERKWPEKYHRFYELHGFVVPTAEALAKDRKLLGQNELKAAIGKLWNHELEERMGQISQKLDKLNEVIAFAQNPPRKGSIEVNGKQFKAKDAMQAYHAISRELEAEQQWFEKKDFELYDLFLQTSELLKPGDTELYDRYEFLRFCLDMSAQTDALKQMIEEEAQTIAQMSQPEDGDIIASARKFRTAKVDFEKLVQTAEGVTVPALKNVDRLDDLKSFLLPEPVAYVSENDINFERLQQLLYQMTDVLSRVNRLAGKNLRTIVGLQEALEEEILS